jgi:predicted transcriptional regulator
MAQAGCAQKIDANLVAEIVRSYVAKNSVAVDRLEDLIATMQRVLGSLGESKLGPCPAPLSAVPIRRSEWPNHVVCLECGSRAQTLRRYCGYSTTRTSPLIGHPDSAGTRRMASVYPPSALIKV